MDGCRDGVVSIGYGLDTTKFDSRKGKVVSVVSKTSRPAQGPTQLLFNGHMGKCDYVLKLIVRFRVVAGL